MLIEGIGQQERHVCSMTRESDHREPVYNETHCPLALFLYLRATAAV